MMKHTISGLAAAVGATMMAAGLLAAPLQAKEFTSSARMTDVLELYTSEGCSSCPPADRWFSTLKERPGLFAQFIPLAFHVDYWNSLGWADRFSSAAFTARQYGHVQVGNTRQSYTPQVVLNNQEWRGHLRGRDSWEPSAAKAGVLRAVLADDQQQLAVNFTPEAGANLPAQLTLNVAYLGMGLETAVQRGENSGRTLKHDFVVLQQTQQSVQNPTSTWQMELPTVPAIGQTQTALVVWLSDPAAGQLIQATGGYL